jgi:hypothetical protein
MHIRNIEVGDEGDNTSPVLLPHGRADEAF